MEKIIRGRVWKFGDNIDTDFIFPGQFMHITDPEETKYYCFKTTYPEFLEKAKPGDIIVAGKNWGCGSSREQAAACLKYFGIGAIVAESVARIYFRNAINLGLPILIAPGVTKIVEQGDELEINLETGEIKNLRTGQTIKAKPLPPFMMEILKAGGLIQYLKKKIESGEIKIGK